MDIKKLFVKYKMDIGNFLFLAAILLFLYWLYCLYSLIAVILNEPPVLPENIKQLISLFSWWINPHTVFLLLLFVTIWVLYRLGDAIHEEANQELLNIRLGRTRSNGGSEDEIEYET